MELSKWETLVSASDVLCLSNIPLAVLVATDLPDFS